MLLHLPKRNKIIAARFFSTTPLFPIPISDLSSHFAALLEECRSPSSIRRLHQQILAQGLLSSPSSSSSSLGVAIVSAYLSCNAQEEAASVLELLSPSPVQFWNLTIRQNIRDGHHDGAFNLCFRMRRAGARPDHYTFPFVLKACGELGSYRYGTRVHALASASGFDSNVFVCNALIAMYSRCSALDDAHQVFDEITSWGIDDVISWNSIVAAHAKCGSPRHALELFAGMETAISERDNRPRRSDVISLVNVLPACAALRALPQAREIHGYAMRNHLFSDVFISNAAIDVYSKCGKMEDALKVFRRMKNKDVVSWNAMVTGYSQNGEFDEAFELFKEMRTQKVELNVVTWSAVIAGYAQRGYGPEALDVFRQMQLAGSKPNAVTIISLLSACASVGALSQGMEVHAHALRICLTNEEGDEEEEEDLMVQNALIDMYSKCKNFIAARSLFDSIPFNRRNVVTWTVMIGGYAQHGDANPSLQLFSDMMKDGSSSPNAFTISCVLMASARLSSLQIGKEIHAYVIRDRYKVEIMFVSNCLIDMYSKCGRIDHAQKVFDKMPRTNYVSWTSLMTGYGMHGYGKDAIRVFNEMQKEGLVPDGVTFLVVLYACSHSGMIEQGLKYFDRMSNYGVVAGAEHYACLVDLLGRHGRFHEAWEKIEKMPIEPTTAIWVALLGACRIHSNVKLAEYAFKKLTDLGYINDGTCTLLSNIYANARCWEDVGKIRHLMKRSGIKKRPGCSWVQGKKGTVTFFVGDRSHPDSQQIYSLLLTLIERIKALGYIPETYFALHDVDDEEKSYLLSVHSEKLALAYGILTSSPGSVIQITKNLRVCGDCHSAITYISMIVDHEIVLRDSSRFHHFKEGACSCHGYW
ncbi:Pentatricopeptide repeat-containing protein [Apostasia shenzhenica]|uniref:Pentatricopeptide repeat-containing protein n=1 Tax=Apostasia shenzhenica TaxID=1088818 RepID=A0A2I0BFZ4_9ASPA|nr:Pentatricopeptide repeat-containing protein [Apostasia shenzhenica]